MNEYVGTFHQPLNGHLYVHIEPSAIGGGLCAWGVSYWPTSSAQPHRIEGIAQDYESASKCADAALRGALLTGVYT